MDIPDQLVAQVKEGKVVPLLGSGASLGAVDADGRHPPTAPELASMLATKFLGGAHSDAALNEVGEYAVALNDLITVQEYIRELFEPFRPSGAHLHLARFSWRAIATTNYDRLIEDAYKESTGAVQKLSAMIRNLDRVDDAQRDPNRIMLLKLHGCIAQTSDPNIPLILTTDQYVTHRKGRERLFDLLKELGHENTIVFIGHSLQDHDVRQVMAELASLGDSRPRYYAVAPNFDTIMQTSWESRRVTALQGTFEEFTRNLDDAIPSAFRALGGLHRDQELPIRERFTAARPAISERLRAFLEQDVEYVQDATVTDVSSPALFYRGAARGWRPMEANWDVRRRLEETILWDHVLLDEGDHPARMELVVIKGHAGAGKSVLLRRIAWEAAHSYDKVCLYVRDHGTVSSAPLQELVEACGERVFLFVDDAAERTRELTRIAQNIGSAGGRLTVVTAARTNEWNVCCAELEPYVTEQYELGYLRPPEIEGLLALLETHAALGTLQDATHEERRAAFADRAGRQLLVALHEATLGRPFEDIVEDEYDNITPSEAQDIYLSICVLNRLGVPVRANIIRHLHSVPFTEFRERLFAPLEHVVLDKYSEVVRDHLYTARHPHIAEIVFERVLRDPEKRYSAYTSCLRALNVAYGDDLKAYRKMVRGRTLDDLFPNHQHVVGIYEIAKKHVGEDAYLLQQMALYEMHRQNGSVARAGDLLTRAARMDEDNPSILHSLAEHRLKRAEHARSIIERDKLLAEAERLAKQVRRLRRDESPAFHTLAKVAIERVKAAIAESALGETPSHLADLIQQAERAIADGIQRFPGDTYMLDADRSLASLLGRGERQRSALTRIVASNPRHTASAVRLARYHRHAGQDSDALGVLQRALEARRDDKGLHYEYAKTLMDLCPDEHGEILYHLERSFQPGDRNYEARILYARQLYIAARLDASRAVLRELQAANIPPGLRNKARFPLPETYRGKVVRVEASYCFVQRDGIADQIYAHKSDFADDLWTTVTKGARLAFRIGFTAQGARAIDVQPA